MRISFSRATFLLAAGSVEPAVFSFRKPWWSELPALPQGSGLYISYQGFAGSHLSDPMLWCDGVCGRFVDGRWTDLVLPGPAFSLELGRSTLPLDCVEQFWADEKWFARKQSLILCMRALHPDGFDAKTQLVVPKELDPESVLSLLLFRLAFPKNEFCLETPDVRLKRLAQNLNIEPLKDAFRGPRVFLPQNLGPREKILELLSWQQEKSPFIPINLWAVIQS